MTNAYSGLQKSCYSQRKRVGFALISPFEIFRLLAVVACALLISSCGGSGSTATGGGGTVAPSITGQPGSVSVQEQGTAQFQVQATGSGTLQFQWLRNSVPITGATQASYSLSPVALSDNGAQFSVTVSNTAGSVTSVAATLNVEPAPMTIATSSASVAPLGEFVLTGTEPLPMTPSGLLSVNEKYFIEYTLGAGAIFTVPALIESDGTIHAVAPPGSISAGQFTAGSVSVRIKRILQTSPTAAPAADYSNSVALNVGALPVLPTPPGYATQLLIVVGKYFAQDAANHSNAVVDALTAQELMSYDFDGLANNVVATMTVADPIALSQIDSFSAATLLTAYSYDIVTGTFATGNSRRQAQTEHGWLHRARAADVTDPDFQALAHSIADYARSIGSTMANAGKVLGVGAAIAGLVVESPLIIAAGVAAATVCWVGTASGTALGFAFDSAAVIPDTSSTPEASTKAVLTTAQYFGASTLSSIIDATVDPADGLANEYLQQKLSPEVYGDYQLGGAFLLAYSGPLSEKIVGYEQTLPGADPNTPPLDSATLNADVQATASIAVDNAIDSAAINLPSAASSGGTDLASLSDQLLNLSNVLQILSASPGNQYMSALQTFGTCSTPFANDIEAIGNDVAATGSVTDQQISQMTSDVQGIISCGSALTQSLGASESNASNTQTGSSGSDQVSVTASKCDANGCWITETTTHSNGTSSVETGYVACQSNGFCPLYLH